MTAPELTHKPDPAADPMAPRQESARLEFEFLTFPAYRRCLTGHFHGLFRDCLGQYGDLGFIGSLTHRHPLAGQV